MERSIGNLTEEMKQHSTPYANLSMRAVERAEINALKAMLPELDDDLGKEDAIPRGGKSLGDGYVLLRAMDTCARDLTDWEEGALRKYLNDNHLGPIPNDWKPMVVRWARLRLPNGQVARSLWKEQRAERVRTSRNVKVTFLHFIKIYSH